MPEEKVSTLNSPGSTDGGQAPNSGEAEGGASSIPDKTGSSTELVSTIRTADTEPEGANNTGAEAEPTGEEKEEKTGEEKPTEEDDAGDRFDKSPRFQELLTRTKAAEDKVQSLTDHILRLQTGTKPEGEEEGGRSFADMDADEIRDAFDDDPKGFLANYGKQIREEVLGEFNSMSEQQNQQQAVVGTIDAYAQENPDFDEMWDKGEIQRYIKENPGHNAISAHMALKKDSFISKEDHDKAVKEAVERERANRTVKQNASVQGAGGSGGRTVQSAASAPELKDTKKFGGRTNALLRRLQQRRAGAG